MGVVSSRRRFINGALGCLTLPASASTTFGCAARLGHARGIARTPGTLRAMTLNLAHGRGRAWTQTQARSADWYRRNLDTVAQMLEREQPDVVALQEAELGSRWAGDFDHVAHLADRAGLAVIATTPFVSVQDRLRYGTALLAAPDIGVEDTGGAAFSAHGRWRKGYTIAHVHAPIGALTVTSLHLDHASARVREAQVHELIDVLGDWAGPHLVLGDFNAPWTPGGPVGLLAAAIGHDAPPRPGPASYPRFGRHLDWILVARPLQVVRNAVLVDDRLSDHRAVLADLR